MPYLAIGGSRETFWKLTPKTIEIDFKAYKMKYEMQLKMAWVQGLYIKQAIQSSVMVCTLADKQNVKKMPKYPDEPKSEQDLTPENIDAQKQLIIAKMDKWVRLNNKK